VGVGIIAAPVVQKIRRKSRVITVACGREGEVKGRKRREKME
jgi:hypothetical protein